MFINLRFFFDLMLDYSLLGRVLLLYVIDLRFWFISGLLYRGVFNYFLNNIFLLAFDHSVLFTLHFFSLLYWLFYFNFIRDYLLVL